MDSVFLLAPRPYARDFRPSLCPAASAALDLASFKAECIDIS